MDLVISTYSSAIIYVSVYSYKVGCWLYWLVGFVRWFDSKDGLVLYILGWRTTLPCQQHPQVWGFKTKNNKKNQNHLCYIIRKFLVNSVLLHYHIITSYTGANSFTQDGYDDTCTYNPSICKVENKEKGSHLLLAYPNEARKIELPKHFHQ